MLSRRVSDHLSHDRFVKNHPYFMRPESRTGPAKTGEQGDSVEKPDDLRKKMDAALASGDQEAFRKLRAKAFGDEKLADVSAKSI